MSEALSYRLSNAGFQVSKYSFGQVEMTMPYLIRRAKENRGVLAAIGFDRQLTRKELARRHDLVPLFCLMLRLKEECELVYCLVENGQWKIGFRLSLALKGLDGLTR